jgi:hypothetical protein
LSSKLKSHLLSTSLFTALFKPEKLKSKPSLSSQTLGNKFLEIQLYSQANLEIIGHPGYQSHIIFATLSKASQLASSVVQPSFFISNIFSIKYSSLCPQETVKQTKGYFISSCFLSR